MRSQASARTSSQYGFPSRCVFAAADSTCTCTRAGTALPPLRDAARRISVNVSKSIILLYHESQWTPLEDRLLVCLGRHAASMLNFGKTGACRPNQAGCLTSVELYAPLLPCF